MNTLLENIIFYAVRYALPRDTTCVPDVIKFFRENKDKMRDIEIAKLIIIIRQSIDSRETNKNGYFSKEWIELLKEYEDDN